MLICNRVLKKTGFQVFRFESKLPSMRRTQPLEQEGAKAYRREVVGLVLYALGRHVLEGADEGAAHGEGALQLGRHAEVRHLDLALAAPPPARQIQRDTWLQYDVYALPYYALEVQGCMRRRRSTLIPLWGVRLVRT